MIIKWRVKAAGGHVSLTMFTAKTEQSTFENSGTLTVRDYEWPVVKAMLAKGLGATAGTDTIRKVIIEEPEPQEATKRFVPAGGCSCEDDKLDKGCEVHWFRASGR